MKCIVFFRTCFIYLFILNVTNWNRTPLPPPFPPLQSLPADLPKIFLMSLHCQVDIIVKH